MATIKDVAKQTGLGIATVSRYINGGNVREKNRIAIEAAIKKLDFSVNELARSLRTDRSRTIGAVIPELNNIFIATILSRVADIFSQYGYGLIINDCRTNPEREKDAILFLLDKQVDGIISMSTNQDGSHLETVIEKKLPVVLIDRMANKIQGKVSAVLVDNVKASEEAVQLLIDAGHSEVGIILGPTNIFTSQQRLLGYQQALVKNSLIPNDQLFCFSDYTIKGGYESAKRLLSEGRVTAIFVTNYEMTLGAMMAINDMHLDIPDDVAFIGFDNMQISQIIKPSLTMVAQPLDKIADCVAEIMLDALSGKNASPVIRTLSTEIQLGNSV